MARRRSGFQKKIESVHWTYGSFGVGPLAAGTQAVNLNAAQHLPETIMRIRGEWVAAFDGPVAPERGVAVTAGMILVPEGTGATVLWSPVSDGDAPWIWWDVLHLIYEEYVTDVVQSAMVSSGRRVIDSKAMRRVRNTELQLVIEAATIGGLGAASIFASGSIRTLSGS